MRELFLWLLLSQILQVILVGLTQLTDSLITNLSHTLTFQFHIFSNLSHRFMLLSDTEVRIDHLTLALVE